MSIYNTNIYSSSSAKSVYGKLSSEPFTYKAKMQKMLKVGNLNLDFNKTSEYRLDLAQLSRAAQSCAGKMDSIIRDLKGSDNQSRRSDARELRVQFIKLATDSKNLAKTITKTERDFKSFDNKFANKYLPQVLSWGGNTSSFDPFGGASRPFSHYNKDYSRNIWGGEFTIPSADKDSSKENKIDTFLKLIKSLLLKHKASLETLKIGSMIGVAEVPETMLGYLSEEQQTLCTSIADDIIAEGKLEGITSEQIANILVLVYGFDGKMDEAANSKDLQHLIEMCKNNPEAYTILAGTGTAKEKATALAPYYNNMSVDELNTVCKTLTKQDIFDRIPDDEIRKDTIERMGLNDDMSIVERMAWMETLQLQEASVICTAASTDRSENLKDDYFGNWTGVSDSQYRDNEMFKARNLEKIYGLPSQNPAGDGKLARATYGVGGYDLGGYLGRHVGMDFGTGGVGDLPHYSAFAGYVENNNAWNGTSLGYGNHLTLKDRNGTTILYAHMNGIPLPEEDSLVLPGELIGVIGNSGLGNTGNANTHIHLEMQSAGSNLDTKTKNVPPTEHDPEGTPGYLDPLDYLPLDTIYWSTDGFKHEDESYTQIDATEEWGGNIYE